MSDLDITPPQIPGKRKDGFLKKFFFKEEKQQPDLDDIKRKLGLDEAPAIPPQQNAAPLPPPDLDDIKQKLGLDDLAAPQPTKAPSPAPQTARVEIHDWTSDAPTHEATPSDWSATAAPVVPAAKSQWSDELELTPDEFAADDLVIEEPPARNPVHHDAVDAHIEPLAKQQERIEKTLLLTDQRPELPEWKLQEREITPEQYFILRNGQPVRSLKELIDALDYIDDTTFAHHVNEYRNDFANWIRDIINDGDLADEIQAAETRPEMVKTLLTHERKVAKQLQKDHAQIQQVVKKREQAMKKLLTVEEQIAQLRAQLEQKTRELTGERKAKSKLIKDKLDEEVKRRLETQRKGLIEARKELASAKKEYHLKTQQLEHEHKALAEREKALMLAEQKHKHALGQLKEERASFAEERKDATALLKDAAHLRKQWDEMKKLGLQTKQDLDAIAKRESALARQEESVRQREARITSDLTKLNEEHARLIALKAEHEKRENQAKATEADATKMMADARARTKEATDLERQSRERIKTDLKKLETLRKQIEASLAKVLKNKDKITTAVALRKHLEESMSKMRQDVAQDRKAMEQESFKSYLETQRETTPAGQPDISHAGDILDVNKRQLPIYEKVEECRQALDRHDLQSAKRLYTELRQDFIDAKLPASEKSALYNSIRELYDDLHLAMLG